MTESAITGVLRLIVAGNTLEALSRLFRLPDDNPLEALNRVLYSHTRESKNPTVLRQIEHHQSQLATATGRARAIILYNLGCLALYQDEIVQAKLYFEQALELLPDWLPIRHNLAFTEELMAEGDQAGRHYAEVIRQNPDFTLSRLNLALLAIQDGRTDEGLATLRQLSETSLDDASLTLYLSRALLHQGTPTDGEEVLGLLENVEDWQRYPDLRECHAFACYLLGRNDEAESAFRALLEDDSYNIFARLGVIKVLCARSEWQELATHAKRLDEVNSTDETRQLLQQLREAGELD